MDDFVAAAAIPKRDLNRYIPLMPPQFIQYWDRGSGVFHGDYYKLVNPALFAGLLAECCPALKGGVVLFATAMADLVVFYRGYVRILNFRHQKITMYTANLDSFLSSMHSEAFICEYFAPVNYREALTQYGPAGFSECYAYSPLLCVGGEEYIENIRMSDLPFYIRSITAFAGPLQNKELRQ